MLRSLRGALLRHSPLTYLTFSLCEIAAALSGRELWWRAAGFLALTLLAVLAGRGRRFLFSLLKTMAVLILLIFVLQSLLYQRPSGILWQWGPLSVKTQGVRYAARLTLALLNISGSIFLLFLLTTPRDLVCMLEVRGLSSKVSYVLLSTLQMIPQMRRQSRVIMDAQRARGVETEGSLLVRTRAFIPMLLPLILNSIISIEERALMLEARAFTSPVQKTHLAVPADPPAERAWRIGLIALAAALILWRLVLWLLSMFTI